MRSGRDPHFKRSAAARPNTKQVHDDMEKQVSEPTHTVEFPHQRGTSYIDEHVDKFDAFSISWNGTEAIHLTFGRDTLAVQTSRLVHFTDSPAKAEAGKVELFRLDVAGISMPIETARQLAETLTKMVERADMESGENV